jgi:hypothetical protein
MLWVIPIFPLKKDGEIALKAIGKKAKDKKAISLTVTLYNIRNYDKSRKKTISSKLHESDK